jgi:hypothetical protein
MSAATQSLELPGCPDTFEQPSLTKIFQYLTVAAKLKDDILLTQPSSHPAAKPPDVLPSGIVTLLSRTCDLPESAVISCWETLKDDVWHQNIFLTPDDSREALFQKYGEDIGFRVYITALHLALIPWSRRTRGFARQTGSGLASMFVLSGDAGIKCSV